MEPFRMIIDSCIYKIISASEEVILLCDVKEKLIDVFNKKINIGNKNEFINNGIDAFIDGVVNDFDIPEVKLNYDEY
jgi:hypothetical protein